MDLLTEVGLIDYKLAENSVAQNKKLKQHIQIRNQPMKKSTNDKWESKFIYLTIGLTFLVLLV